MRGRADLPAMLRRSLALALVVLSGCHLRAGVDAASRIRGPVQAVMAQSTVSRSDGVINLPTDGGRNYALEAGFGYRAFTFDAVVAAHDVAASSFTPGAGTLATTLGASVRWTALRWNGLSPSLAAGPARMVLLDRATGERSWGTGVRVGGGVHYAIGKVAVFADAYREVVAFRGGVADGTSTLDGVTVGLALQP